MTTEKFSMPKTKNEATELLNKLKEIDGKSLNEKDISDLGKIMLEIRKEWSGIRNVIAIIFKESENQLCIPFLIKTLKNNIHTKYVSTLIYACSSIDCSEHLQLFVDLLILKKDVSFVDAYYAIKNMNSIEALDRIYAINKLRAFKKTKNKKYSLWNELGEAIELLEGK